MTSVRSCYTAATVPGLTAPFDTAHIKLFYPARPTGDESERMSGEIAADPSLAPWPVIVMAPAINVAPATTWWLAAALAARGYAVASYEVVAETFGGSSGLTPVIDLAMMRPESYGSATPAPAIGPVIDAVRRLGQLPPLAGLIDADRVVIGGQSAGGTTALSAADPAFEHGVVGCFSYAGHAMPSMVLGWPSGSVLPLTGRVPTLLVAGDSDSVMAASAARYGESAGNRADPMVRTFDALPGGRGDAWHLVVAGGTHFSLAHPVDHTSGRSFLEPPPVADQAPIRDRVAEAIGLFCDAYARQDPRAVATLASWVDAPPLPVCEVRRK